MPSSSNQASLELNSDGTVLLLQGDWRVGCSLAVDALIQQLPLSYQQANIIDTQHMTHLDTAGALLLSHLEKQYEKITIIGLQEHFKALLDLVKKNSQTVEIKKEPQKKVVSFWYWIGKKSTNSFQQLSFFLAFLGEIAARIFYILINPMRLQWRSTLHEIDVGGYRALPIIAVMMFLIGIVVAYQLGVQLQIYGANVYVVDLSGVAILREFSPLISSVIIAGRTSTSFAALIGTMKVNEEVDALETMGISSIERLVIPKIMGLLVALPLLVVWGDIFGLFGSMVMAKSMAGIGFTAFLQRFKQEVAIKHLYLGLVKTPVFALIIAGIGCYQGFLAEGSAESVGARTTKAAVQAIFLIILADGLFSILFNWMDI